MLFNSLTFLVFFSVVFLTFWSVSGVGLRLWILLGSSLLFYASWSLRYTFFLVLSLLINYAMLEGFRRTPRYARALLWAGVVFNLGTLGMFKYWAFARENFQTLLGALGASVVVPSLSLAAPLGISFYTFHVLSCIVDAYRGKRIHFAGVRDFFAYVTFFPQLIAGPIVRFDEFIPQIPNLSRRLSEHPVLPGLKRVVVGVTKKVLIADWLATLVDPVFESPGQFSSVANLVAVYAYAFQIYFDFSGYCDIAVGVASLLGIRLPENFQQPYLSKGITEFWHRWHITLSRWLRDYVYIPLGGNRSSAARTYANLMITMLLGGLWHGASWNFVLWGAVHGAALALAKGARTWMPRTCHAWDNLPAPVSAFLTFQFVSATWILFRGQHLAVVKVLVGKIASLGFTPDGLASIALVSVGAFGLYFLVHSLGVRCLAYMPATRTGAALAGIGLGIWLVGACLLVAPGAEFIYFQF